MNLRLLSLVEEVLGKSKKTSRNNYSFYCPFCNHQKRKLEVDITSGHYHCWTCNVRGKTITTLFKKLRVDNILIKKLYDLLGSSQLTYNKEYDKSSNNLELPNEFIPLWIKSNSPEYKNAISYLFKRGVMFSDILKYRLGYCESGSYKHKIIIPSYDEFGKLNFFTGRSYYDVDFKHKNPEISKDVIGFELQVNWSHPVVLVEGAFDAIAIKRNCIPLFGKIVLSELKKKIIQHKVKSIYIALDKDALRNALQITEYFMNNGIDVHFIDMVKKDPSDIGFKGMCEMIKKSEPITFRKLMEYKFQK